MNREKGQDIWIIGAGDMAVQYSKVLDALKKEYIVIGRGEESAKSFETKTGHKVITGGVEKYLSESSCIPQYAVVAVYPAMLKDVTIALIKAGIRNILVEKPAGINREEIDSLFQTTEASESNVYVAYNRRFYSSVLEAQKIIAEDGGVTSFNFEFTEWGHVIRQYEKPRIELENWFMANSTHVIDLAFYLGGEPRQISCYTAGSLDWYTRASCFAGAGVTDRDVLFSYNANWDSAGRWSLSVLTNKHKLIFEPMEKLKIQYKGSVQVNEVEIDDKLDIDFKPGIYRQTEAFLNGDSSRMINIADHLQRAKIYEMMESTVNSDI